MYRPEVDGLRAVAVVPVILFHAGFPQFSGGYIGVDVFFVVSGYLITSIILAEKARGTFTFAGFYERRARRILPALLFVTAVCLVPAWLWMVPDRFKAFSQSLVGVVLFSSNVLFWRKSGYFESATEERPLLHTWSLGVEEQFYVFFPMLLIGLWWVGRRRLTWLLVAIAIGSFALSVYLDRRDPMANFYLAPTRAWELLIGALLAFASARVPLHARVGAATAQWLSALGLAMIVVAIVGLDESSDVPGFHALLPTIGTALVLAFAVSGTQVARMLSLKWVVGIGLVSYSAYLWHQPLMAYARIGMLDKPGPVVFGMLAVASIALAGLTWRFVERPFRDRNRVGRRTLVLCCVSGSFAILVTGLAGHVANGFPGRLDPEGLNLVRTALHSPKRAECHTGGRRFRDPFKACTYFHENTTWATLGDSHTVEPGYALAEKLALQQQGLVHLSFSACPPALLFDARTPGCSDWLKRALERVEGDRSIRNVLVGFRLSYHLFGDQLDDYPDLPDVVPDIGSPDPRELMWQSFAAILERLQKSGKRVFVLLPIPELGRDIQKNILAKMRGFEDEYSVGTTRAYFEARHRFVREKLAGLQWSATLVAVDPSETLCDDTNCYAVLDGSAMYFDDDHLSIEGARRVTNFFDPYLDRLSWGGTPR